MKWTLLFLETLLILVKQLADSPELTIRTTSMLSYSPHPRMFLMHLRALKTGISSAVNRVSIFAWTNSVFWCGSMVSSRALKTGMCSRVDRVRIFRWTEFSFWCGLVVSNRALKTGMCSGLPPPPSKSPLAGDWGGGGWVYFFLFFFYFLLKINYATSPNCIGPTIRIGREILCLPYPGFFLKRPSVAIDVLQISLGSTDKVKMKIKGIKDNKKCTWTNLHHFF